MPLSLVDLLRQRYLETIDSVRPASGRWKILVVDQHTQDLLNNVLKMFEILERGVQQIDLIENQRNPQPGLEAIYLLAPTEKNVERIIRDFAPPSAAPSSKRGAPPPTPSGGPKYAGAHLFFVDALDDALVNQLTGSPAADYLRQLVELFTNFWANEAQVFTLRPPNPKSFVALYAPPERSPKEALQAWEDEVSWISRCLINTLATLGENPYIRYYNPSTPPLGPAAAKSEHLCKRIALRLQADLDEYCRNNPDFPPPAEPPRPRGTFFVTERAMDLQAPLLHEFTYQAMCNDLLEIVDGRKYTYSFRGSTGAMEEKEAILSEEDKVWTEVRHMHMKDALDKLIADFKQYAGEHGHLANGSSLNDMKDMLANLPQLRESKEKMSLHLTMAETCMDLFERRKLPLSASVEQCCATGMTAEGKTPKTLVEEMVPLLDDRSVSSIDKVRIIALYILHRDGVPEEDKRRLYQHAHLGLHEMDAVNNLVYLGANVTKDSGKKRKPLFKQPVDDEAYDISRYQPLVKLMLDEHIANKLDASTFPYVRDSPPPPTGRGSLSQANTGAPASLRSARPTWQTARTRAPPESRQRVMVFVAGGMTWSEVRSAYAVSKAHSKDVVIGSTHIYNPKQFIHDLSDMDRAGGASLLSHGAPADAYEGVQKVVTKEQKKRDKSGASASGGRGRYADGATAATGAGAGPSTPSPSLGSYRADQRPGSGSTTGGYLDAAPRPKIPSHASSVSTVSSLGQQAIPSVTGSLSSSSAAMAAAGLNGGKMDEKKKKGFFGRSKK